MIALVAVVLVTLACSAGSGHRNGSMLLAPGSTEGTSHSSASDGSFVFAHHASNAEFPVPTAMIHSGDFLSELKAENTSFVHDFATTAELPFVPLGLPAGLPLRMAGDAEAASLKIYSSYPEGDAIATYDLAEGPAYLPGQPGEYYLRLRGEWSDGWASYFSGIRVLAPGTVQFVFDDIGGKGATVALWIDGQRTDGDVVHRIHIEGDDRIESSYPPTNFPPDAYALVHAGARIEVQGEPQELSAALTAPRWADASDPGTAFSLFGPYARIPVESGRHLLVLDAV